MTFVLLGKCDDIIRDLAKELGLEELDKEWAATVRSLDTHEASPDAPTRWKDLTDETNLDRELEEIVDRVAEVVNSVGYPWGMGSHTKTHGSWWGPWTMGIL